MRRVGEFRTMRNISFALTTEQFLSGQKDVTRRFGWWGLKPGDQVRAVEKAMGLKKGEKMKVLGVIEVVSVRREPLNTMAPEDCALEGFPHFTPDQFVDMLRELPEGFSCPTTGSMVTTAGARSA